LSFLFRVLRRVLAAIAQHANSIVKFIDKVAARKKCT
jgi:hypothetical protein